MAVGLAAIQKGRPVFRYAALSKVPTQQRLLRNGAQVGAIDEAVKVPNVAIATPATVKAVGMAIGS